MAHEKAILNADPLLRDIPTHEGYKVLGGVVLYHKLGQGGMGAVYKGHHLRLDVDVAVKVLAVPSGLSEDRGRDYRSRFTREARTAATVRHQNLIRVYDVDSYAETHFIVMDFIDGESVGGKLTRMGRLPESEAVEICLRAAEGLAEAHSEGVVHRDVKPDNLLMDKKGRIVVADLGLAKPVGTGDGDDGAPLTRTQTAMGTPYYMAPEQFSSSKSVGPQADVWSLGVTLYQLLTGSLPWMDTSIFDLANKIRSDPLPDILASFPSLKPRLAGIIRIALSKNAADRYQDCGAMASALAECVEPCDSQQDSLLLESVPANTSSAPPPAQTLSLIAESMMQAPLQGLPLEKPDKLQDANRAGGIQHRIKRLRETMKTIGHNIGVSDIEYASCAKLVQEAVNKLEEGNLEEAERFLVGAERGLHAAEEKATHNRPMSAYRVFVFAAAVVLAAVAVLIWDHQFASLGNKKPEVGTALQGQPHLVGSDHIRGETEPDVESVANIAVPSDAGVLEQSTEPTGEESDVPVREYLSADLVVAEGEVLTEPAEMPTPKKLMLDPKDARRVEVERMRDHDVLRLAENFDKALLAQDFKKASSILESIAQRRERAAARVGIDIEKLKRTLVEQFGEAREALKQQQDEEEADRLSREIDKSIAIRNPSIAARYLRMLDALPHTSAGRQTHRDAFRRRIDQLGQLQVAYAKGAAARSVALGVLVAQVGADVKKGGHQYALRNLRRSPSYVAYSEYPEFRALLRKLEVDAAAAKD